MDKQEYGSEKYLDWFKLKRVRRGISEPTTDHIAEDLEEVEVAYLINVLWQ